jgi:hypothetical protein
MPGQRSVKKRFVGAWVAVELREIIDEIARSQNLDRTAVIEMLLRKGVGNSHGKPEARQSR